MLTNFGYYITALQKREKSVMKIRENIKKRAVSLKLTALLVFIISWTSLFGGRRCDGLCPPYQLCRNHQSEGAGNHMHRLLWSS